MAAKDDYLIEQLVDLGYVTNEQLAPFQAEAAASGVGVIDLLLERKILRQIDVATAKAAHFGAELVKLSELRSDDEVISAAVMKGVVPGHPGMRAELVEVSRAAFPEVVVKAEVKVANEIASDALKEV